MPELLRQIAGQRCRALGMFPFGKKQWSRVVLCYTGFTDEV